MKRRTTQSRLARVPLLARIAGLYVCLALGIGVVSLTYANFSSSVTPVAAQTQVVIPDPEPVVEKQRLEGVPVRLVVSRLGVDLAVHEGFYDPDTQEWTLNDTDAFFMVLTHQPNDVGGNTFIYGHNQAAVFLPLAGLEVGDIVDLYTSNNLHFVYRYDHDSFVAPTMTQILYEEAETPQLILMTCEGVLSEARRIMYFTYQEVKHE